MARCVKCRAKGEVFVYRPWQNPEKELYLCEACIQADKEEEGEVAEEWAMQQAYEINYPELEG